MDQIALVDRKIADGQKLVLQLAHDGFDVTAAFWLKGPEDAWAHLFLASRAIDEVGPGEGYRAVQASLQRLPGLSISLTEVKVIGVANWLTGAVRKLQQQAGGQGPIHLRGGQLGNVAVEEAYIYPPLARQKRHLVSLGKRKLKTAVEQTSRMDEMLGPLSAQESRAMEQMVASGISPAQADYWVRKKREQERERPPIPAGTVVNTQVVAWWGESPEDDPNPLLRVEAADGSQGLTLKHNTEPV
jgi:hypothetical protein